MRSLLLLPLLGPLLAIVLVAALNPRPQVSLRLLIWSTPSLPLGAWMALAAAGGSALSGSAAALALSRPERRRQSGSDARGPMGGRAGGDWSRADEAATAATPRSAAAKRPPAAAAAAEPARSSAAGPARAPGEPPPTVAVPYRVIQRPAHASAAPAAPAAAAATVTAAAGDWDSPPEEDW